MAAPRPAAPGLSRWRHIPNMLSLLRMVLVVPVVICIATGAYAGALWLALVAGVSDALDGALARRFHWQSRLGGVLDPVADKLLVVTCFVMLTLLGPVPLALMVLVLARDVIIAAGALAWQRVIGRFHAHPSWVSKACTVFQIAYLLLVLLDAAGQRLVPLRPLAWSVAALTVVSGLDYIVRWGRMARRELRKPHTHVHAQAKGDDDES